MKKFRKGDRVIENATAPRTRRQVRDGIFRRGTVVGVRSRIPGCVTVRFDHFRATKTLHIDFIDRVADEAAYRECEQIVMRTGLRPTAFETAMAIADSIHSRSKQ